MIVGYKPNGYILVANEFGKMIQGETRQCVHCQYSWVYRPGSGDIRGFCTRHMGFICARAQCYQKQQERIAALGDWPYDCISFADYNMKRFERMLGKREYQVTTAGVFVPVTE